ncbi:hypothetical protein CDD83_3133 [Cordyceps sp. RAO-2017]|nr:hypothetical protein CDD83_3133 [Cordyceps sp. RAO-2017]
MVPATPDSGSAFYTDQCKPLPNINDAVRGRRVTRTPTGCNPDVPGIGHAFLRPRTLGSRFSRRGRRRRICFNPGYATAASPPAKCEARSSVKINIQVYDVDGRPRLLTDRNKILRHAILCMRMWQWHDATPTSISIRAEDNQASLGAWSSKDPRLDRRANSYVGGINPQRLRKGFSRSSPDHRNSASALAKACAALGVSLQVPVEWSWDQRNQCHIALENGCIFARRSVRRYM